MAELINIRGSMSVTDLVESLAVHDFTGIISDEALTAQQLVLPHDSRLEVLAP